jgi:hypothetical protein
MQLLLDQNQRHSRRLFLACLFIAPVLTPIVLALVNRSIAALHPKQNHSQPAAHGNSTSWDLRAM